MAAEARAVRHQAAATDHLPAAVHKADQEERAAPVHRAAAEAVPDKNRLIIELRDRVHVTLSFLQKSFYHTKYWSYGNRRRNR
jgi:hypothetical protein